MKREKQRLRVDIPVEREDLVRAVRMRAGLEDKTVSEIIRMALESYLAAEIAHAKQFLKKEGKQ